MDESPVDEGPLLDRREAIRRVSAWLGGVTLVGGCGLLATVERARAGTADPSGAHIGEFTTAQIALLDEIAETILPATRTPGAKAAKTGAFMALMVTDGYSPVERQIFIEGMREVDVAMRKAHQVSFMEATPPQRLALLTVLDIDQKRVMDARAVADKGRASRGELRAVPYFRMMKELAMLGFFTSEVGCTLA
jgi:Gluconate 2-dehydrogenase subunit 3